ncbi:MAG: class I SAM-dependent methyltransferase [Gammaproteobacteria bacterium]
MKENSPSTLFPGDCNTFCAQQADSESLTRQLPPCPITGRPARRRIQNISKKLLRGLWRRGLGVDIGNLLEGIDAIGLYESDCGLVYFYPLIAGDHAFYEAFYRKVSLHRRLNSHVMVRQEFCRAARYVEADAAVLDIGCGRGSFSRHLPGARYCGLDPFAPEDAYPSVLRESLENHLEHCAGTYDVVTAFQVIEHVADPKGFAMLMARALKPGGILILCAPLHPSAISALPNFIHNALPHHLTWWTTGAFAALADTLGLQVLEIAAIEASPHEGVIHWMERFFFCKTSNEERYFAHRWSWHLNLLLSYALAQAIYPFRCLPRDARPAQLLLAARKPEAVDSL